MIDQIIRILPDEYESLVLSIMNDRRRNINITVKDLKDQLNERYLMIKRKLKKGKRGRRGKKSSESDTSGNNDSIEKL